MTSATYSSVAHAREERPERPDHGAFSDFAWTSENTKRVKTILARYPEGRQASAVLPLLDLAQRQVGAATKTQGWLPIPVMEHVARALDMPYIRVWEVATFYTMFNLAPVGRYHVQLCGTTPCMLRGSEDIVRALADKGIVKGKTTPDGLFTLTEVECLGACVNAPMVQINDDNYEDLTCESMGRIIDELAAGRQPEPGPQVDRKFSAAISGQTTLKEFAGDA